MDVHLQVGQAAARGQRRKAVIRDISGVGHGGVSNSSTSIWFTGERHCTVFRHVMQLSLFGLVLEKHFDGDFTADQEKDITFKHWQPGYQS